MFKVSFSKVAAGAVVLALVVACNGEPAAQKQPPADYSESTVAELQSMMSNGELTARELAAWYLDRIDTLDRGENGLNAIIEINPDALAIADALDAERAAGSVRGPLHGIPVVLKANIDTGDSMATSAGSLALADHRAPDDAFLVARLREAGALILGKANLSEWANFRSDHSSSGWSSLGGQTGNAYDPARNPCGSSSGSAVAVSANLATLAVGTETDGSIVCPASINGIVGIKPTLGLVSRDGIIPIAHSQDTAGPMARTVVDAALMLNAMVAPDDTDPATGDRPDSLPDYAADLDPSALQGARIGVIRNFYGAGRARHVDDIYQAAVEQLRAQGAVIVDPVDVDTDGMGDAEFEVLLYEFKADLNNYLSESGAPIATLADIIEFNETNADRVMPFFGQNTLVESQAKGPLTEDAYLQALEDSKRIARDAIDNALATHDLDALIAPTNAPAWLTDHINGDTFSAGSSSLAAVSGYANVTVPAGNAFGLPVGLSFIGGAFSERRLIELAHAFEQATGARREPDPLHPTRP